MRSADELEAQHPGGDGHVQRLDVAGHRDRDPLLHEAGFTSFGLAAGGDRSLWDPRPLPDRSAFVLGSETGGIRVDVQHRLSIPMAGDVESLNVAVAAGVLCFELVRRSLG